MIAAMRLIQGFCGLVGAIALIGCGQSSAPSGGHEAATATATATAASADLPPPTATAKTEGSAASVPTVVAVVSAAPSATTATTATSTKGVTVAPVVTATATATAAVVAPTATAVATVEPKPIVEVMSPKVTEGSFNTWMQSSGRYTVGQQGNVQVVLVAKIGRASCRERV